MFDRLDKGLWWDKALTLVEGCTPVSSACDNCWAKEQMHMKYLTDNGKWTGEIKVREDRLDIPLRTRKPTVFAVWNDLFHEDVPIEFIAQAFNVMVAWRLSCRKTHDHDEAECYKDPGHTYLVLTKRPERMSKVLTEELPNFIGNFWPGDAPLCISYEAGWPPSNIWLGVTAEDQVTADERIPILLQIQAAKRFISIEPMLGPIDIENVPTTRIEGQDPDGNSTLRVINHLDWIICGGESGSNARPMHPDWVRSLRDQCNTSGVPFFFKQWGEWAPDELWFDDLKRPAGSRYVQWDHNMEMITETKDPLYLKRGSIEVPVQTVRKVGKKTAGRILDGSEYLGLPATKE